MSVYDHIPRWQYATSLKLDKWMEIPLPFGWVIMLGLFCDEGSLFLSVIVDGG
jgi:hypothetical protein